MKYHVQNKNAPWELFLARVSDEELTKWGTDPDCMEMETCAAFLSERLAKREIDDAQRLAARTATRREVQENPFNPRTEISADARHIAGRIVKHLWILFVLLPLVAGVLLALLGVIK